MKARKKIKGVLIAVAIGVAVLTIAFVVLFFFPSNAYSRKSTDLADYGRFIEESGPVAVLLFPDESLLTEENCVFYDNYKFDGSNTPQYCAFALCSFSEESFEREIDRLAGLASEYSEIYFNRPAFILYMNYVGSSEYALVDRDSCSIHYISFGSERFYDQIPAEDKIGSEYSDVKVKFRDADSFLKERDGSNWEVGQGTVPCPTYIRFSGT